MEKQFKIIIFVILFGGLAGVGLFGYINTKKQTDELKKIIDVLRSEKSDEISTLHGLVKSQQSELSNLNASLNQQIQEAKRRAAQIRAEEERKEAERQLALQKEAEELERERIKKEEEAAKKEKDRLAALNKPKPVAPKPKVTAAKPKPKVVPKKPVPKKK